MVFRIPRDEDPYNSGSPDNYGEIPSGIQPTTGPLLIPPFNPGIDESPVIPPGSDVRGPRPTPPGGFSSVGGGNEGYTEPIEPTGNTGGGPPPTAFNPPSAAPRFNFASGGGAPSPGNNTVVSPPRPFNTQPPPGRLPTGSYRSYRPNLKTRNDAYLRGYGNELGANPSPAFTNPDDVGYGGLRIGGYNDPSNPLLSEERKRRQGGGGQYSGAFGLGLGS